MTQIAAELSVTFDHRVTKNSVVGKCNRLGLRRKPAKPQEGEPEVIELVITEAPPAPAVAHPSVVLIENEPEPDQSRAIHEVFGPYGVRIMDLTATTCRFIEGDPVDAIYCGQHVAINSPWCQRHTELCGGRRFPKRIASAVYKNTVHRLSKFIARG